MNLQLIVVAAALLAGCATSPPTLQAQKPAPIGQVASLPAVTSAKPATVRVVRDEGLMVGNLFLHVSVDGKKVVSLNPGEFQEFKIDAGEYLLSAILTDVFNDRHPTVLEANFKEGTRYNYRAGIDGNGLVNLFRVP